MRRILRATLLVAVVLLVPVLPLAVLGLSFEDRLEEVLRREMPPAARFGLMVGLLAIDVFLPIPSSMVSTYGGGILGTWPATAASWLGMTAGAIIGFGLARQFGRPLAARLSGERDLDSMEGLVHRFGPLALVLTRALPILAEACVLLMGASGLGWRRFLIPVAASNLVVSVIYAAFGEFAEGRDALLPAAVASGTVPLLIALVARRWLPQWSLVDTNADRE